MVRHEIKFILSYLILSNYIFILDLTPDFNGLGKDNCKMRRDSFKFWDLVHLILRDFTVSKILFKSPRHQWVKHPAELSLPSTPVIGTAVIHSHVKKFPSTNTR